MSGLEIDPGPAPEPSATGGDGDVEEGYVAPPTPAGELPEWEVRSVGFLLGLVFMGLHLTLGRGGPEDAFLPSDAQRREMATPAASMLNRSARARRYAPAGDGVAFAGIFGEYVISEQTRVAAYRRAVAAGEPPEEVAQFSFAVTPAGEASRVEEPQLRPWRPPVPADEDQ